MTVRIKSKLKAARRAYKLRVGGALSLAFEARRRGHAEARLVSGEEVALELAGELLRGGDLLVASDGRVIEVLAAPEKLLHVVCASHAELARTAYLLGERHVPVQLGDGFLRLADDRALADLLHKTGAQVRVIEAPFEPELGAAAIGERAAHHHHHHHDHDHDHDHEHDHEHEHPHPRRGKDEHD
jgi:urease accessory protein